MGGLLSSLRNNIKSDRSKEYSKITEPKNENDGIKDGSMVKPPGLHSSSNINRQWLLNSNRFGYLIEDSQQKEIRLDHTSIDDNTSLLDDTILERRQTLDQVKARPILKDGPIWSSIDGTQPTAEQRALRDPSVHPMFKDGGLSAEQMRQELLNDAIQPGTKLPLLSMDNDDNQQTQSMSIEESSRDVDLNVPSIDMDNRVLTQREKQIIEQQREILGKSKWISKFAKKSVHKYILLYLLCCFGSLLCGFIYPFNTSINILLKENLGMIQANITFITSVSYTSFLSWAGFTGFWYDRYEFKKHNRYLLIIGSFMIYLGLWMMSNTINNDPNNDSDEDGDYSLMLSLCFSNGISSAGMGVCWMYLLCFLIKSIIDDGSNHNNKQRIYFILIGIFVSCWLGGSYLIPFIFNDIDNNNNRFTLMFKGLMMATYFLFLAMVIPINKQTKQPALYDYNINQWDKHYHSLKQMRHIKFWCVLLFGSIMINSVSVYPSLFINILDTFNESYSIPKYRFIFTHFYIMSFTSVFISIIVGIIIDYIRFLDINTTNNINLRSIWMMIVIPSVCLIVFIHSLIIFFDMYLLLVYISYLSGISLSISWLSIIGIISYQFGSKNFGKNFGLLLIISSLILGFMLVYHGFNYASQIDDGGIKCSKFQDCFLGVFSLNLGLTLSSFMFLSVSIPPLRSHSQSMDAALVNSNVIRGVSEVKYRDQIAEDMYGDARNQMGLGWVTQSKSTAIKTSSMNSTTESTMMMDDKDDWADDTIIYASQQSKNAFFNDDDSDQRGWDDQMDGDVRDANQRSDDMNEEKEEKQGLGEYGFGYDSEQDDYDENGDWGNDEIIYADDQAQRIFGGNGGLFNDDWDEDEHEQTIHEEQNQNDNQPGQNSGEDEGNEGDQFSGNYD